MLKKLVFSLVLYHSTLVERKKFGSIGWNYQYNWMPSDIIISIQQSNVQ